jgi:hypothetical protein
VNNDAKGLTFLTLSIIFLWLVFDDLVGKKRLSRVAKMIAPDLNVPSLGDIASDVTEKVVDGAKESVKETAKDTREAQKKADDKVADVLYKPPFKVSNKTKETLDRLHKNSTNSKKVSAYKDRGWLGYSWEDLWNDVKGWF